MKISFKYLSIIIHFLKAKAVLIICIFLIVYCAALFYDKHYEPQEISDFEKLKYYKVRSKGVGMVITATTYVSPSGKGFPDALWNTIINTPGWFPIGQVGNIE